MKKCLAAILIAGLMLCLAACTKGGQGGETSGNESQNPAGKFTMGFAREDIRPTESVPMAGYGNTTGRMSMGSLDYTYVSAVVCSDAEGETIAILSYDIISLSAKVCEYILEEVEKTTGIPSDHLILNCSHTHSGPDCGQTQLPAVVSYMSQYVPQKSAKAVLAALADRSEATLYTGTAEAKEMNFIRHYLMNDGTYAGDNFGDFSSGIKDYAEKADEEVKLLSFRREGKKDVLVMNYQCHSQMLGRENLEISSDWVGVVRTNVEKELGVYMTYLQGAAGDLNGHSSRITESLKIRDYKLYGDAFAPVIIDAYKTMEEMPAGKIQVHKEPIVAKADHTDDAKVGVAKDVVEYCLDHFADVAACTSYAKANGFNSYYHASGAVSKAANGPTVELFTGAFSIGDIGFGMIGAEVFCEQGRYIKENSPFKFTMMLGYSQNMRSYLPNQLGYVMNCYEVNISPYAAGTAEQAASQVVTYLNDLHKNLE